MTTDDLAGVMGFHKCILFALQICGGIVMGIGIWAVVDKIYISDVIGNTLFASAAILMVICGSFLLLVSFLGCIGTIANSRLIISLVSTENLIS